MVNLRLLHVLKNLEIGGIQRTSITYLNEIKGAAQFIGIFSPKGIYYNSGFISSGITFINSLAPVNLFLMFILIPRLFFVLMKYKINTIHYHHRVYILFIYLVKIFAPKIRIIYTHHSVYNDKINRFLYANQFVAISEETKKELILNRKGNIHLIPHGIKIDELKKVNICEKIRTIGYIGRFDLIKGIFTLLDAFLLMIKKYPDLKLELHGDGKQKNEIINFIASHNLLNNVFLTKPEYLLERIYEGVDLLVVPSISLEGFGLVIIEAMSFGIPVVVSDLPVFLETIINFKTGLVFEHNNPVDLRNKIIEIVEDEELRSTIILNAYSLVVKDFNLQKSISKYLQLLTDN